MASNYVSKSDFSIVERFGCAVIDCSWNQLESTPFNKMKSYYPRLLPYLSCVEAFAAALYITGFPEYSDVVLSKFKWGHNFIDLNRELLEKYSCCETESEICEIEKDWVKKCEAEYEAVKETDMMNIEMGCEGVFNPNHTSNLLVGRKKLCENDSDLDESEESGSICSDDSDDDLDNDQDDVHDNGDEFEEVLDKFGNTITVK